MNNRVVYFDILNVVSCIAVVCLHANSYVHTFIKDDWWWIRVLIEVLFYFAVPVFFMLTGATLMDYRKRYTTKEFYQKRFLKTFIPFVFWSFVFYVLYFMGGHKSLEWRDVIERITTGHIPYTNYWFFIPLFMIYVFMPFLSLMVTNMSRRTVIALCILLFIFQSFLPTLYFIMGVGFHVSLPIGGYFIFVLLGYCLATFDVENNKRFMALVGGGSIVAMMIRYVLIFISETKEEAMFTYMGFYSIFPAMYVFLCVKRWSSSLKLENRNIWTWLSKRSFGVYLIHTVLIFAMSKLIERCNPWFIPISFIFAYLTSVAFTVVMQKNKISSLFIP